MTESRHSSNRERLTAAFEAFCGVLERNQRHIVQYDIIGDIHHPETLTVNQVALIVVDPTYEIRSLKE